MSEKMLSVMSEMVTKVCEQDKEIARLRAELESVKADRDGCCEEVDKRDATITALWYLWDVISERFPDKWDHLQHDLRDKNGNIDNKAIEDITRAVEETDHLR
jgi:uncharacterized small protein (DUF1192 family)